MTTRSDGKGEGDGEGRLATATAKVSDVATQAYGSAVERVTDVYASARDTASDAYATARDKAGDAYASVRDKAGDAYSAARERAAGAGKATSDGVQANPFVALIGGLAVGAVAGALIPRSERETALLAPFGARLADMARLAAVAAKDAGLDALGEAGISRDAARSQVDKLLDTALGAARAAGGAAAESVRKPAQ